MPVKQDVFSLEKSRGLYLEAKRFIPGGTQLLSKRPEMHLPDLWPTYYEKAAGCEVWDLDGNKYIDMSYMGIGACILGYADPDVNAAVKHAVDRGSMSTLNCPEEVELAKLLCEMHPWAQMARFSRTGGEAMAMAIRIARAKTGKDVILFCGYHGWHDWYLSSNLADNAALDGHLLQGLNPKGVPRGLQGTAIPFAYNDKGTFLSLMEEYDGNIAAVVMEPIRNAEPEGGFLEIIREITQSREIPLIFDEITVGWRLNNGGAHLKFDVIPDVAVFGKGMSNGFSMAAVIGKSEIMDEFQNTFISSTYWTERIGPTAALAAIRKMANKNVPEHLAVIGKMVQDGWRELSNKYGLKLNIGGMYPLSHFTFPEPNRLVLKTLFTQTMLEKGYLASTAYYASYAHTAEIVKNYLAAGEETFIFLKKAMDEGNPERYLKAQPCHAGFMRLT